MGTQPRAEEEEEEQSRDNYSVFVDLFVVRRSSSRVGFDCILTTCGYGWLLCANPAEEARKRPN